MVSAGLGQGGKVAGGARNPGQRALRVGGQTAFFVTAMSREYLSFNPLLFFFTCFVVVVVVVVVVVALFMLLDK